MPNQTLPTYKIRSAIDIRFIWHLSFALSHVMCKPQFSQTAIKSLIFCLPPYAVHLQRAQHSMHWPVKINTCARDTLSIMKSEIILFLSTHMDFFSLYICCAALRKYPVIILAMLSSSDRSLNHSFEIYDNKNIFCTENKSDIFL